MTIFETTMKPKPSATRLEQQSFLTTLINLICDVLLCFTKQKCLRCIFQKNIDIRVDEKHDNNSHNARKTYELLLTLQKTDAYSFCFCQYLDHQMQKMELF